MHGQKNIKLRALGVHLCSPPHGLPQPAQSACRFRNISLPTRVSPRKTDQEIKILNYILEMPVRISVGTPPIMTDGRGFFLQAKTRSITFKLSRCVGLTTLPPLCADCL